MKQIILRANDRLATEAGGPCLTRIALTWTGYGYVVALLCGALPADPLGGVAAWGVALLGGLALAAWTMGV